MSERQFNSNKPRTGIKWSKNVKVSDEGHIDKSDTD